MRGIYFYKIKGSYDSFSEAENYSFPPCSVIGKSLMT